MRPKLRYRRGYSNRGRRRQLRIDVGASLHRIVDSIEAALRLRGIGFEESGGTLAVTKKHADYGMRPLSLQRLIKVIEHTIEFGSFTCRDKAGNPSCWVPCDVPREAVALALDRIGERAAVHWLLDRRAKLIKAEQV